MIKLELLKLAIKIYPCPKFRGVEIGINVVWYEDYNKYKITFKGNCYDRYKYCHILWWICLICKYVNIQYRNVHVNYD